MVNKKGNKNLKLIKEAEKLTKELVNLLGCQAEIKIFYDQENAAIRINLDSKEEKGLLIGKRGETLNSFQKALGIMLKQKVGEWVRVIVDVGDWREKHEEYLKNIALQAAQRAKETGKAQSLYNLSPYQRRIVHLLIAESKDLVSESTGEGEDRYLVIKPKKLAGGKK